MSGSSKNPRNIRLGEIADFVMGQAPPGADCNFEERGTPFVKAGEFGEKRPIIKEWTTRPLKRALASDVLICVVGATSGKLNLGADCAIGRSVAAIRPRPGTFAEFLYYQLLPKVLELRQRASGSAQGVISKEMLASIPIFLPPHEEQERIVTKLNALLARSKKARDDLDRIPMLMERFKRAIMHAGWTGNLTQDWRARNGAGEMAWKRVMIREVAEVVTGFTPPTKERSRFFGGDIPFYKPTDLAAGYYVEKSRETLTEAGASVGRRVPKGSTLVTCIGATIGKTGFARNDCCTNQQINALNSRPNETGAGMAVLDGGKPSISGEHSR